MRHLGKLLRGTMHSTILFIFNNFLLTFDNLLSHRLQTSHPQPLHRHPPCSSQSFSSSSSSSSIILLSFSTIPCPSRCQAHPPHPLYISWSSAPFPRPHPCRHHHPSLGPPLHLCIHHYWSSTRTTTSRSLGISSCISSSSYKNTHFCSNIYSLHQ